MERPPSARFAPRRRIADRRLLTRGQAFAEFVLVLPILALLLAAVAQFALVFETQIGVTNAVREAARRAAATPTDATSVATNGSWARNYVLSQMASTVQGYASSNVTEAQVCYATVTDASGTSKTDVTIDVHYGHVIFIPLVARFLDGVDGNVDGVFSVASSLEMEVQESAAGAVGCYAS